MHNQLLAAPVDVPGSFFQRQPQVAQVVNTPGSLISHLLPNILIVCGVIFFAMILYAGFLIVIYGGQNLPPQKLAEYKNSIIMGSIGLLTVISAYFILQILSSVLGINFINPPL